MTRFRAPGGAPDPEPRGELDESGYRDRPMPVAASVLWTPVDATAPVTPTVPIFISQQALIALHDHARAAAGACFGMLSGDVFRSPDSGAPYLVVASTIRLSSDATQDARAVLTEGWVAALDLSRGSGMQLVGWYRAGESAAAEPSPAELETHAALFPQPWQILVTASSGAPCVGGVYCPPAASASAPPPSPFFELMDPSSNPDDDRPRPRLQWTNYRSDVVVSVRPTKVARAVPRPLRPAPLIILPDQGDAPVTPPVGGSTLRRLAQRRALRVVTFATGGVVALGLLRAFLAAPTPLPSQPVVAPPTAASPPERLDRAGDTLALALAAFELRARLFANRQMQCQELSRGLVLVEERWTAYNAARKDAGVALDSARTARDRALYADADAVEQRFERSGCSRP
ncbi:MAG TPA: hypothetical protein VJN39_03140 [Gemmatimonadales bacterium]|nr:hypothetical protein [Gemmatimonadales bacterium]